MRGLAFLLPLLLAAPALAGNHHQQLILQSGLAVSPFAIPVAVPVVTVAPHSYSLGFSGQAYAPQAAPQARVQSTKSAEDALVDRLVEKLAARLGLDAKPASVDPHPLLTANCLSCHNATKKSGGVDFSGELTDELRLRAIGAMLSDKDSARMPKGKQLDANSLGKLIQEFSKKPLVIKSAELPEVPK